MAASSPRIAAMACAWAVAPSNLGAARPPVGLDDTVLLELSQNGGAGLLVVTDGFGSEARIDSRQIIFSGNAGGATVGNVLDVAVGP